MSASAMRPTDTSEDDLGGSTKGFRSDIVEAGMSEGGEDRYSDGSLDATARIVDAGADSDDERVVEAALRPKRLSEFPGQTRVRDQLGLVLEAARRRGSVPDHILLSGPPGLGKTTLALIVAAELERPIRITSGPGHPARGRPGGRAVVAR